MAKRETLNERRRRIAAQGPYSFAQVYLPHLLIAQDDIYDRDPEEFPDAKVIIEAGTTVEASQFHHMLYDAAKAPKANKARLAWVAPRGFAKSTAITICVLYWAAFKLRWFVLWTSETASQVEELVASIIDEIEAGGAMLDDFPHLAPKLDPTAGR